MYPYPSQRGLYTNEIRFTIGSKIHPQTEPSVLQPPRVQDRLEYNHMYEGETLVFQDIFSWVTFLQIRRTVIRLG